MEEQQPSHHLEKEEEPPHQEEQEEKREEEHKTLNHHSLYYTFTQRYFTTYATPTQYLHLHSNGLFLVRVRTDALPSPPISISCTLQAQQVKGKKKRGGTRVSKNTVLAEVECQKGEKVPVRALIEGVILQINQRLKPELLCRAEGYIAVINPIRKFKANPLEFEQMLLPHQL